MQYIIIAVGYTSTAIIKTVWKIDTEISILIQVAKIFGYLNMH